MTGKKNIWVEKSDQNYHHYNTSLKENIVQMFLRCPQEKIFGAEKRSFISSFFYRSKEAKRMTGSNFARPPFSSACKAL